MSANINYMSTLLLGAATLTTGDTSRTAPSTVSILSTPASGGLYERIMVTPLATVVASVVRIFRYDGSAYHLFCEIQVPAQTLVAGTAVVPITLEAVDNPNLFPMVVPTNWSVRATVNDTQTALQVSIEGGGS